MRGCGDEKLDGCVITEKDMLVIRHECIHYENTYPCPDDCPYFDKKEVDCTWDIEEYLRSCLHCHYEAIRAKATAAVIEDYTRELKERICKSDLPSPCFDRLSMIIHDTVISLRGSRKK